MTSPQRDITQLTVIVFLVRTWFSAVAAETVYFNNFGDCLHNRVTKAWPLRDGAFRLEAVDPNSMHENTLCTMVFQAPSGSGICLTFQHVHFDTCNAHLKLYHGTDSVGDLWKNLTCNDRSVPQMCTSRRYVTVQLKKVQLSRNTGYSFRISVDKRHGFNGEDVFLASTIGLFVGIIVGVIGLIVIVAVIVRCCFCKSRRSPPQPPSAEGGGVGGGGAAGGEKGGGEGETASLRRAPVQPSAPPPPPDMEDEHTPLHPGGGTPMYPALPHPTPHPYPTDYSTEQHPPPPPYAPPPYETHDFADRV